MADSRFVYVTYIRTTPEQLWKTADLARWVELAAARLGVPGGEVTPWG